ncbi:MAG: hypothetical protein AAB482_01200 [Patescibacteria group bacterium]
MKNILHWLTILLFAGIACFFSVLVVQSLYGGEAGGSGISLLGVGYGISVALPAGFIALGLYMKWKFIYLLALVVLSFSALNMFLTGSSSEIYVAIGSAVATILFALDWRTYFSKH